MTLGKGLQGMDGEAWSRAVVSDGAAWFTAFYCLADCMRKATHGAVNHKSLYALVSSNDRYVNHENPMVRKRTAGALSRIVHSKRYMLDMQEAYARDETVFDRAALRVCSAIRDKRSLDDVGFKEWLISKCWPDVRQGLINESGEWRRDLNLFRLDCEMSMLFESGRSSDEGACSGESLLSAIFYAIAFGHLDEEAAHLLVDQGFAGRIRQDEGLSGGIRASLVRFSDSSWKVLSGFWVIDGGKPFTIGRYTDCDAIELSQEVSRVHCHIRRCDDAWLLEVENPKGGGQVHRNGMSAHDLGADDSKSVFQLEITLPGGSVFLFSFTGA